MTTHNQRIIALQSEMVRDNVSALVLAPTNQMKYLTGWAESGHERFLALLVPDSGDPIFITPSLNAAQARSGTEIKDVRGWDDTSGWHGLAKAVISQWDLVGKTIAIDDEMDAVHLLGLQSLVASTFISGSSLMAKLRMVKKQDELDAMVRSAKVTDQVYENSLSYLRDGMTEVEFKDIIAAEFKKFGTKPDFSIICFGENSAIPHHSSGSRTLSKGDIVLIDIGCTVDDYCSDITRTVSYGEPNHPDAKDIYKIVYEAHYAAHNHVKTGVTCESVDSAARGVIERAGYGEYFMHRTGHGIGLSGHEPPYVVQGNKQILEVGMCFSDEPGIYLEGRFGVRIENCLYVSDDGPVSFDAAPPAELIVL